MEFYVVDSENKKLRHRVPYADVISCHSVTGGCTIVLNGRPSITLKNSIDVVFDFYFKKITGFIRSSENFIVNTSHILTAEEREFSSNIQLTLTGNNIVMLRRSHDYAYFIMNGQMRRKAAIINCDVKDKLVMSDIKDIRQIVTEIRKATGEAVSSRWVLKRYKQLKIQS